MKNIDRKTDYISYILFSIDSLKAMMASKDDPVSGINKSYAIRIYEENDEDDSCDNSRFPDDKLGHVTESHENDGRTDRKHIRVTRRQWRQGKQKSTCFLRNSGDSKDQCLVYTREQKYDEGKAHDSIGRSNTEKGRSGRRARSKNKENVIVAAHEVPLASYNRSDKHLVKAEKTIEPLRFGKLVFLSKQLNEPDQVLLEISNSKSGFKEFLEKPIDAKCYVLLLKILSAVVKSQQLQGLRQVLQLVEQYLLAQLPEILTNLNIKTQETRYIWNNKSELTKFLSMIAAVLRKSLTILHSSLSKCSAVISLMREVMKQFFPYGEAKQLEEEIEETDLVKKSILEEKHKIQQDRQKAMVRPNRRSSDENKLPPEDFRTLSILPSLVDLHMDEKPFLRANKAKGNYDSLETYLDIQYRLLREDFIAPLRRGISHYRESIRQKSKLTRFTDIRVYDNVQILRPVCSPSGINYIIQFDVSKFARINWDASKRLLHGSLLCLSDDSFETAFYAVVSGRKREDLKEGMLQVQFENFPEWIQPGDRFVMAETTAYYEAYRHILQGLQETQSMPLQRYIIDCDTTVKPPEYLLHLGGPKYDFSSLLKDGCGLSEFPVLNTFLWPKESSLELDPSQCEAMKAAITKELAIIQGPPGTGKTFVGLKIARLLKENKKIWQKDKDSHAILVVCYTNHALDQFLEGVLDFADESVVRIGGRCNSEILEPYTLSKLKKKKREERSITWSIFQNTKDCERLLKQSEQFITDISSKLKNTCTELVSFELLSEFMSEEQFASFDRNCKDMRERNSILYDWLGLNLNNDHEMLSEEESRLRFQWETYVVEKAERFPEGHKSTASSVWALDLDERARMYKTWLFDYIATIELKLKEIQSHTDDKTFTATVPFLEELIFSAQTHIVDARTIVKYISSLVNKAQVQQLIHESLHVFSPEKVIETWLCLDGDFKSNERISEALNKIQGHVDKTSDLEEERELRDEDVFFTFDNDNEDENRYAKDRGNVHEEWSLLLKKKNIKQAVSALLRNSKDISAERAASFIDVWQISMSERRDIYRCWLEMYRNKLREQVKNYEKDFNDAVKRLEEVRNQETIEILKSANFIGMTTTGAAKYRQLLQNVGPRIIIVEEAAEVLESHVVTTLNDKCKHLILIGDHKQLRPSTTVYELAKKYNLEISLFERMVNNGVPCVTLSEQHRMRPSISILMRHKNLYPNLNDHPVVYTYDAVKGLDVNVQFINHEEVEGSNSESSSYYNIYEAKFLSRFCAHLLKQGYGPDQISVLTPYVGQVFTLRKEMPKPEFEGVRITAVDNFQGEENDIILLSLVRSSKPSCTETRNPIGFLGVENRVCVALSRARQGLFVIGNFSLLREKSAIWDYMVQNVEKIDKSIKLVCQNHPQNVLLVAKPDDFNKTPEGGCQESCGFLLKCGHICERFCHIIDKDHNYVKCFKPCTKKCEFGHRCKRKCYEDCKKCETLVLKTVPMCNHIVSMPCHKDPYTWSCKEECSFKLRCGHICGQLCWQCTTSGHRIECKVKCDRKLDCGHTKKVECYLGTNVECDFPCDTILDCGHKCTGKCNACIGGKIHVGCKGLCRKLLPCGHKCSFLCSEVCPPCPRRCEYVCSHNIRCSKKCSEPCDDCMEICKFGCKHKTCSNLCSEPCSDIKCNEPCFSKFRNENKSEGCEHKCSGLCGEVCPQICAVCNIKEMTDLEYTFSKNDRFIQLPDCKHIIEVKTMDAIMSQPFGYFEKVKRCPKCKKVIRKSIKRYANVLRESRQTVVKAFEATNGSDKERMKEASSLAREINALKHIGIGLKDEEVSVLLKQVDPSKFETLQVSKNKIFHINDLLLIRSNLQMFFRQFSNKETMQYCIDEIENAIKVQRILLQEKRFVSQQYWHEVGMEIRRIDCVLRFIRLREDKFSGGFTDNVLQSCFEQSMKLLTGHYRFDESKVEVIEKVMRRLSNAGKDDMESEGTVPAFHSYRVDGNLVEENSAGK